MPSPLNESFEITMPGEGEVVPAVSYAVTMPAADHKPAEAWPVEMGDEASDSLIAHRVKIKTTVKTSCECSKGCACNLGQCGGEGCPSRPVPADQARPVPAATQPTAKAATVTNEIPPEVLGSWQGSRCVNGQCGPATIRRGLFGRRR
jgi:hypothetical protein